MNGSGETRWMDNPKLPSQILSTPIVPTPDTVTITISREDAEAFQDPDGNWVNESTERLAASCQVALEGEQ